MSEMINLRISSQQLFLIAFDWEYFYFVTRPVDPLSNNTSCGHLEIIVAPLFRAETRLVERQEGTVCTVILRPYLSNKLTGTQSTQGYAESCRKTTNINEPNQPLKGATTRTASSHSHSRSLGDAF